MSYLAFKDTDIGRIPCDWSVKTVASITKVTAGGTPSTARPEFWKEEIPWMRSGDIHKKIVRKVEGSISKLGLNSSSATLLPPNCVLVALAGQGKTRGTVAINEIELSTNQSIAAVYPTAQLDSKYLYYYLDSKYNELRGMSQGDGGRGGLNLTIIGKINFPYPDLLEQHAIATALSDMDALIEAKTALMEKKRAIKQGAMQELLTGRRRLPGFAVTPMKKTDIGEIPEDWEIRRLGKVGGFFKGAGISKVDLASDGVPCIRYAELYTTYGSASSVTVPESKVSLEKAEVKANYGDIIFAGSGETFEDIGRALAYVGSEEIAVGGDTIIYTNHDFEPRFLGYVLNSPAIVRQKMTLATGTTIIHIHNKQLKMLITPYPGFNEQIAIADTLSEMESEIASLTSEIAKLRDLKQGMMQELLTGRIRLSK